MSSDPVGFISDFIPTILLSLLLLRILLYVRRVELQGRRNTQALIALAEEIGTPGAEQAAWLLVPEKHRPKSSQGPGRTCRW